MRPATGRPPPARLAPREGPSASSAPAPSSSSSPPSRTRLADAGHEHVIVHTGQHYDARMSDVFFADLGIPDPDVHLGDRLGLARRADRGDARRPRRRCSSSTAPTGCSSTATRTRRSPGRCRAVKMHLPLAHLEAGLRSFNRRMPEEHNRVLTDHAADLCLAPTEVALGHLRDEGLAERSVVTGDVMTDVCLRTARAGRRPSAPSCPAGVDARRLRPLDDPPGREHRRPRRGCARSSTGWPRSPTPWCSPPTRASSPRRPSTASTSTRGRCTRSSRSTTPRWSAAVSGGPGRRHRLRRAAEGGLPPAHAVHDGAHRDGVDRDRRPRLERAGPRPSTLPAVVDRPAPAPTTPPPTATATRPRPRSPRWPSTVPADRPDADDGPGARPPARRRRWRQTATTCPVSEDSMHASATLTVRMPCDIVTMSASWPSTASRNCSCSVRSGSGFAIA